MTKKSSITQKETLHVAELAKLQVSPEEKSYLTEQFNETLNVIDRLNELPTRSINETSQVTGLKNVFRKDRVEKNRVLSQTQALSNAKRKYKGYFVVKAVLDEK